MPYYDLIMIAVLIVATLFGMIKGMAWQLASLASLVVSYLLALMFCDVVASYVTLDPPLNQMVAMLIIFVTVSAVIWLLFRLVSQAIDRVKLREFDRQMGALLGFAKGVLLCIVITFFAVSLIEGAWRDSILTSKSGHYIGYLIDRAPAVLPEGVHESLKPHLELLDENLEHDHVDFHHGALETVPSEHRPVPASIEADRQGVDRQASEEENASSGFGD